jgi:hypothetical protein
MMMNIFFFNAKASNIAKKTAHLELWEHRIGTMSDNYQRWDPSVVAGCRCSEVVYALKIQILTSKW